MRGAPCVDGIEQDEDAGQMGQIGGEAKDVHPGRVPGPAAVAEGRRGPGPHARPGAQGKRMMKVASRTRSDARQHEWRAGARVLTSAARGTAAT